MSKNIEYKQKISNINYFDRIIKIDKQIKEQLSADDKWFKYGF
jgi:hypothetical protein